MMHRAKEETILQNLTYRVKAAMFYALALSLGFATLLLAPVFGTLITILYMFTPLLAVLLMLLVGTRDGYTKAGWAALGLHHRGVRAWGLAVLLPCLTLGFGYSVVWLTGVASFAMPAGGLASLPLEVAFAFVIALPLAFGEELGWRGYLLPKLAALPRGRMLLFSGLLHGIWHLPVLLLTPFYHSAGNPLIVTALFLATLTLAGVVYGYLRLMTDSAWPAVIVHGTANAVWGMLNGLTIATSSVMLEYLAGEIGLLLLIATTVVAGWVLHRLGQGPRADQQPLAPPIKANA
jgi:membrane protease YdiL (CAAX protease family)